MTTSVVVDPFWGPKLTLSRDDFGGFDAVIEIGALDPQRGTTVEERFAGIRSLNPPTVRISPKRTREATMRALIDTCCLAVGVAATSSAGNSGGPAGLLLTYFRVVLVVRRGLRLLKENI